MKGIIFLFILLPLFGFCQLSELALIQKNEHPERYELLKEFSENKWHEDYKMQVYEINKQTASMCKLGAKLIEYLYNPGESKLDSEIFFGAVSKWLCSGEEVYNENILSMSTEIMKRLTKVVRDSKKNNINYIDDDHFTILVNAYIENIEKLKIDWSMVEYTYNKQLEAKKQL